MVTKTKKAAPKKVLAEVPQDFVPDLEVVEQAPEAPAPAAAPKAKAEELVPIMIRSHGADAFPRKDKNGINRYFIKGSVTGANGHQEFEVECDRQVMVTKSVASALIELVRYQQSNA